MKAKSSSILPQHKVAVSGLAGAIACLLLYALDRFAGVSLPPAEASALTVIVHFVVGYWVRPQLHETVPDV